MATLVFGALGTLVGGPIGGAVGALLGREADRMILGTPTREGPRLKELAVSSSSYGQPIARLFGATRAAGTILWATDLKESSETAGGGKGRPKTTQYSYSVSLAVALSSRPIEALGRIWADGNLLRGAAGDLKTGGTLRLYRGLADQAPDPLLAVALGAQCPAHRGLAYVVLEDLQLGEFGNRIPALSFEVFTNGAGADLISAVASAATVPVRAAPVPAAGGLGGFVHEGGSLTQILNLLGEAVPLVADAAGDGLSLGPQDAGAAPVGLPAAIAWPDGDFGARTGARRSQAGAAAVTALRYYDSGRDYQPGYQRPAGRAPRTGEQPLELPATLDAAAARALVETISQRGHAAAERMQVRVAALGEALGPGAVVAEPDGGALWRVDGWEWREGGVEIDLRRLHSASASTPASDGGAPWRPADRLPVATCFAAFELPWDGAGAPDTARVHAALSAGAGRWAGAALYVERGGALVPLATAGPIRAVTARLETALEGSPALLFEPRAAIELRCDDPSAGFLTTDGAALAAGANRLLVGAEIVQFMQATSLGGGAWRLSGLLRGRGATEAEARAGHAVGTPAVQLDDRLLLLDGATFDPATERLAAIGVGDAEPVFTAVEAPGRSRRPLPPVHPTAQFGPDGSLALGWTRRARGAWIWRDGVEAPLVEEAERYEVGAGAVDAPVAAWPVTAPALELTPAELSGLPGGTTLWVRQIGDHGRSPAILLSTLP